MITRYLKYLRDTVDCKLHITNAEYDECTIHDIRVSDIQCKSKEMLLKSIDDLKNCTLSVFELQEPGIKNADFDTQMEFCGRLLSIFYLVWMQFTNEEISTIKLSEFNKKEKTILGKKIEDEEIFKTFVAYTNTSYQLTKFGRGYRKLPYCESGLFIRTLDNGRAADSLNANAIYKLMSTFRNRAIKSGCQEVKEMALKLSQENIRKSSMIIGLDEFNVDNSYGFKIEAIKFLMSFTGKPKVTCEAYLRDYNKIRNNG